MNILIIGNGFDLAHELPTRYVDFLEFIIAIKNEKFGNKLLMQRKFTDRILELKGLIEDNFWLDLFIKRKEIIDISNEGWIDFENEISKTINFIEKILEKEGVSDIDELTAPTGLKSDRWLKDKRKDLLQMIYNEKDIYGNFYMEIKLIKKKLINSLLYDLNRAIRALEIYLDISVQDQKEKIELIESLKIESVLSFNYTYTYKTLYDKTNGKVNYDYIHGSVDLERKMELNNMVLGIDEHLPDDLKNKELDFIKFKKYFQRMHKKTGCEYKKWFEGSEACDVFVFGHSLDVTDKDIFKEILLRENTVITIFYFNEEVYSQQIINLVKIIGQDKLTEKVYGTKPSIIFLNQNEEFIQPKVKSIFRIPPVVYKDSGWSGNKFENN